jgi:hypothetical protein
MWTLIPGVPIRCRSPRKRGPYSMPIHRSVRVRQRRRDPRLPRAVERRRAEMGSLQRTRLHAMRSLRRGAWLRGLRGGRSSGPQIASEDEPAIFATRYEDSHGDVETRTFRTRALALAWQADIGRRNWDDERDGPPPDDVGAAWFELQADRGQASFSVTPCRLEG